jgi:hypothetical protein
MQNEFENPALLCIKKYLPFVQVEGNLSLQLVSDGEMIACTARSIFGEQKPDTSY